MSIESRSKVHYNRSNNVRPKVTRRKRWEGRSKEVVELLVKITLTVIIAVVALALIVGFVALCVWVIVDGVNDIADNGFNVWSAAWVALGIFGLSGTPTATTTASRKMKTR